MKSLPNLIAHLAPIAEHYLTLVKVHPSLRYDYSKRKYFNLPVIEVVQHGQKCRNAEKGSRGYILQFQKQLILPP